MLINENFLFNQLTEYFKFRNDFKKLEEKGYDKFIQNEYYLISKEWIQNWKQYTRYKEIKKILENKIQLGNNYIPFIYNFIRQKINLNQYPLNNSIIYNNGEINPLANFIIINRKCFNLFKPGKGNEKTYHQCSRFVADGTHRLPRRKDWFVTFCLCRS